VSKEDVLALSDRISADPRIEYSGNLFIQEVVKRASLIMEEDRTSLVEVLRDWIRARDRTVTLKGVFLAGDLGLWELKPDIEDACKRYSQDGFFKPHNAESVKHVLAKLDKARTDCSRSSE